MVSEKESGIIEVDISKEMVDQATARNNSFYVKYGKHGTHRTEKKRDRIRTTGFVAEIAVKEAYQNLEFSDDDKYDFCYNGVTFDVKAQGCNSIPRKDYVATLYSDQRKRKVDVYIFTRVKNDYSKAWIGGFIFQDMFFKKAKYVEKGTQNNNFTYDQSRYEIVYDELNKLKFNAVC